jgi:hypothetical protein
VVLERGPEIADLDVAEASGFRRLRRPGRLVLGRGWLGRASQACKGLPGLVKVPPVGVAEIGVPEQRADRDAVWRAAPEGGPFLRRLLAIELTRVLCRPPHEQIEAEIGTARDGVDRQADLVPMLPIRRIVVRDRLDGGGDLGLLGQRPVVLRGLGSGRRRVAHGFDQPGRRGRDRHGGIDPGVGLAFPGRGRTDHHPAVAADIDPGREFGRRAADGDVWRLAEVVVQAAVGRRRLQGSGQGLVPFLEVLQAGEAILVVPFGRVDVEHQEIVRRSGRQADVGVRPSLPIVPDHARIA